MTESTTSTATSVTTSSGAFKPRFDVPLLGETVPDSADPGAWAQRCVAHQYHAPIPRYLEAHHVIPRAWQALWKPDDATAIIWAPTTVLLCRTGHGNVHYWIERFMKAFDGSMERAKAAAMEGQESVGRQEHVIAYRALQEFRSRGGSLEMLVEQHAWGGLYGGNTAE